MVTVFQCFRSMLSGVWVWICANTHKHTHICMNTRTPFHKSRACVLLCHRVVEFNACICCCCRMYKYAHILAHLWLFSTQFHRNEQNRRWIHPWTECILHDLKDRLTYDNANVLDTNPKPVCIGKLHCSKHAQRRTSANLKENHLACYSFLDNVMNWVLVAFF